MGIHDRSSKSFILSSTVIHNSHPSANDHTHILSKAIVNASQYSTLSLHSTEQIVNHPRCSSPHSPSSSRHSLSPHKFWQHQHHTSRKSTVHPDVPNMSAWTQICPVSRSGCTR